MIRSLVEQFKSHIGADRERLRIPYKDVIVNSFKGYQVVYGDQDLCDANRGCFPESILMDKELHDATDGRCASLQEEGLLVCRGTNIGEPEADTFVGALVYTNGQEPEKMRWPAALRIHYDWCIAGPRDFVEAVHSDVLRNVELYASMSHPKWTQFVRREEAKLATAYLDQGWQILELGAGDGFIADQLGRQGFSVYPTDVAPRYP